jgi:hypothetical protein
MKSTPKNIENYPLRRSLTGNIKYFFEYILATPFLNFYFFRVAFIAFFRSLLAPKKVVLFFPEQPSVWSIEFKICKLLGYGIVNDPTASFDVGLKRKDETLSPPDLLKDIPTVKKQLINANSINISKDKVDEVFEKIFGYGVKIDPTNYYGQIVEKSNLNGVHSGRVIKAPIACEQVRNGFVYQKLIDNFSEVFGLVLDYRVPIHGNQIPFVYLKYRSLETRFSNTNTFVRLARVNSVFTTEEVAKILEFAQNMALDYGELDILRDNDQKIYIVDVNNTPMGPPNGLSKEDSLNALVLLAQSFDHLLEIYSNSS